MDVVLLQDVDKVGLKGDVVSVARGYARNYLLPRRLGEPATPGRLAELHRHEELRARHEAQTVEQAREVAATLEASELRFDRKAGERGSLFGSVTATDIADEIWRSKRIRVDRRKIRLPDPIKRIGRYEIPVEIFTDVSVDVRTLVVPEGAELPPDEPALAVEADADAGVSEGSEAAPAAVAEATAEASGSEPTPVDAVGDAPDASAE
jgi:large subunit ribosomal protein L9